MQLSNAPAKLTVAFANAGSKNVIPVPSQIPITPGAASFTDGFPPLTMTPPSGGGVPPSGLDMNGILFDATAPAVWYNAGAGYLWDSAFSTAVGGYPQGARVLMATGNGYWRSTVDNNTTDPDTGGAGWTPDGGGGVATSVYASAQQALAVGESKVLYDTVEFDPTGQWDATNKRFRALFAGQYRLSGATYLKAPAAQILGSSIYKNGTLSKIGYQGYQVSNVDLTLSFSAIIAMNIGDYLEVFVQAAQFTINAGIVGSNEAYVYGQFEYLG